MLQVIRPALQTCSGRAYLTTTVYSIQ